MKSIVIRINSSSIKAEIANNSFARAIGLMFRKKLNPNEGMLFTFGKEFFPRFWMAGMRFPLDMIWIDKNKRIVDITRDAKPSLNPIKTYSPKKACKYVLEVNANFSEKHKIEINNHLIFD